MPTFKAAYLIHGDDHGRIAERRARLRVLAEAQSGAQGVELFEGDVAAPEDVAMALGTMTLAFGRRFIIVDGVERWKEKDAEPLVAALGSIAPETTVAFFAREDARQRAPKSLIEAIRKAGGDVSVEASVKPWELPKWVVARAKELGVGLDTDAARALIRNVGDRQQRLMREVEKLSLSVTPGTAVDADLVEELTAASAERKTWSLADALVAGDARSAITLYLGLRAQGERVPGLLYWMTQRVRTALEVAVAVESGEPANEVKRKLRMPVRAAERLIADARRAGSEHLRRALEELADLELASRGGGAGGAGEDTAALRTIQRVAG